MTSLSSSQNAFDSEQHGPQKRRFAALCRPLRAPRRILSPCRGCGVPCCPTDISPSRCVRSKSGPCPRMPISHGSRRRESQLESRKGSQTKATFALLAPRSRARPLRAAAPRDGFAGAVRRVVLHLPVSFPFLASFRHIALSFGALSG